MSHGKLREEKDCLNCGHIVEERFCPNCGQENTETRQPFHFLFTHFIEDFTHYDGQFWKTIKYLLFRPGKLTKEYISGKRQQYVAPVKLYIFISFLTFFLPGILPSEHSDDKEQKQQKEVTAQQKKKTIDSVYNVGIKTLQENPDLTSEQKDYIINKLKREKSEDKNAEKSQNYFDIDKDGVSSEMVLNSSDKKKNNSVLSRIQNLFEKRAEKYEKEGLTSKQINEKILETFIHMLPKALFFYLPVFAFFLWLFHNKKRWWYFEHGIFTLHYFSFLLISTLFLIIFNFLNELIGFSVIQIIYSILIFSMVIYSILYFFIAHYRVYGSKKRFTILKGIALLFINSICLFILLIALVATSFLLIH